LIDDRPAEEDAGERESENRPGDDDASPSAAAANDRASESDHIDALRRLEEEYLRLDYMEDDIKECLGRLRDEEASLRLAREQSSTSLREQRELASKRREDEAVARLEEALMMDGDCSDDSDDGSGMLVSKTI